MSCRRRCWPTWRQLRRGHCRTIQTKKTRKDHGFSSKSFGVLAGMAAVGRFEPGSGVILLPFATSCGDAAVRLYGIN